MNLIEPICVQAKVFWHREVVEAIILIGMTIF